MDEVGETSRITAEDINNTEETVIPVSESKVAEQYTGISHFYKSIKPPEFKTSAYQFVYVCVYIYCIRLKIFQCSYMLVIESVSAYFLSKYGVHLF